MTRTANPMRRGASWVVVVLALGLLFPALAANVVTDGDMEDPGTGFWPRVDVTGTNSHAKTTTQSASGRSLRADSQTGNRANREWYNAQSVGTIDSAATVNLSLWYGWQHWINTQSGATVQLWIDIKPTAGSTWTNIWTSGDLGSSTTFQSSTANTDVSGSFTVTQDYDIRLRVTGKTGRDNSAYFTAWWDDVVLDVTGVGNATTIGDGADPAAAPSLCPGGPATMLDAFTFQTDGNTDNVQNVTVSLSAGSAASLSLVEITDDGGGTVYGSTANPATDSFAISLTGLGATTTLTQYKIRVTPRAHVDMAAPPGTTYTVTGTVSDFTPATNTKAGSDVDSDTVSIDNQSPAGASFTGCNGSSPSQIDLTWTHPADADFNEVVVVRGPLGGTCPSFAPTEGVTYGPGAQGADTIVYNGVDTAYGDTGLTSDSSYCYEVWARDDCGNWSAAPPDTTTCSTQAAGNTTTLGDGTDPAIGPSACPGGSANELDAFTLQTDGNTDAVTSVTVTMTPAGSATVVGLVEITSDDGLTVYGSVSDPATDAVAVTVTGLDATTTLTQHKVRITPRSHAGMPAPPGSSYAVQGTVTAFNPATNATAGSDTDSDTVTIDNQSPTGATFSGCSGINGSQIQLDWTNPADTDFFQVVVVRGPDGGACPTFTPTEGTAYAPGAQGADTIVYAGSLATFTDSGLSADTSYCYEIWAEDDCGNFFEGPPDSTTCSTTIQLADEVHPGTATAAIDSCTQITVSAPFTNDGNGNSTTDVRRGPSATGPWTDICLGLIGGSPRICIDNPLAGNSSQHYQVTFDDVDGVVGANPQVIGPYLTPYCDPETTVVASEATASTCDQITVTTRFTGDRNGDGTTAVEWSDAGQGTWATSCATLTGGSPRSCLVTGLLPNQSYDVRVTYSDPDGVFGTPQETIAGVALGTCGADHAAPTVLVISPARGAVIGSTERFKVQVFDRDGTISALEWAVDGGTFTSFLGSQNANYDCGAGCAIYEFDLDTTGLSNDDHSLRVRAADDTANEAMASSSFTVNNQGGSAGGDGRLLRRSHGSSLCTDCHNLPTHSSQYSSNKYGNWAIDCIACHTPHRTTNIKLVRSTVTSPNSGDMTVEFHLDDEAGSTNPGDLPGDNPGRLSYLGDRSGVDNAPYNDGVCEVCHTRTKHWRNDATGLHAHSADRRCADCHGHADGFGAGACDKCHGAPPTVGKHGVHDQVSAGEIQTTYETADNRTTQTEYGFPCAKCHAGEHGSDVTHAGTQADPYQVEVVFDDTTAPANAGGTYVQVYPDATDQGNDPAQWWSWTASVAGTDGRCGNLYCHSNAAPLGDTLQYAPVQWNQAGSLDCTGCHDGAGATTALSIAHRAHTDPAKYDFGCVRCHDLTVSDNATVSDKTYHVNEVKDVDFDNSGVNNSGGAYDDVNYTCSDTYCHSNGQNGTPPYSSGPSIAWNTTASCRSCHDGDASAAPTMSSGKHGAHVNNAAIIGTNFGCVACHDATVSDNTTISTFGNHVNGAPDVSITSGGTFTDPTCTNTYCHSSGQTALVRESYDADWSTGTLDCKGCHGRHSDNAFVSVAGEPNYTSTAAGADEANSHQEHVFSATDCAACHDDTTADGTSIKSGATIHTDGTRDVVIHANRDGNGGTGSDNYDSGTKTCSQVDCHPSASPVWGDDLAIECRDCHMASGAGNQDVDDYVYGLGSEIAKIDGDDWLAYGHGAAASYTETGNPGADFDNGGQDGCMYCHLDTVPHGDPSGPFRLANTGGADGKNGNCLICHKDAGDPGYDPGTGSINGTRKVGTAHYGTKHGVGGGGEGGAFCWDCHDPHGDYNYTDTVRLGYMVQLEPVQSHDGQGGWGVPTILAPTPDFRNDRDGTGGFDWGDFVIDTVGADSNFHGLCQVCHTTNSRFLQAEIDGYTFAQDANHFPNEGTCTVAGCHLHNNNFKNKGCNECHNAPPDPGPGADVHGTHYSTGVVPTTYADTTPSTTATDYGFACVKCHAATHLNDTTHTGTTPGDAFFSEVVFDDTTDPKNPGGTYSQVYPDAVDQGPDGRYWSWTDNPSPDAECGNLYCHSNAAPVGGTNDFKTAHWPANTLTCTGCHAVSGSDEGGAATDLSANHGKHVNSGLYAYTCDECHSTVVPDDSTSQIADKRNHVQGVKDVAFSSTAFPLDRVDQSGGDYTAGTCSATYCHSQGTSTTAPFPAPNSDPDWNAGSTSCDTCHGGNSGAATVLATAAHAAHMNNASYLGDDLMCARCHSATVDAADDTVLEATTGYLEHVDGEPDVGMADGGTYNAGACADSYCHSDGTETPGYVAPPTWKSGTTLPNDCKACHGAEGGSIAGEPRYPNDTGSLDTRNSHPVADHVSGAGDCVKCHDSATDAVGALISSGTHLDQARDVSNATFISSYDEGTETCTSVCHGGNLALWGDDTIGCRDCHMTSGAGGQDVDDYVWDNLFNDGTGTASIVDGDEWTSYGHGASSAFGESGNPGPNFDAGGQDGCLYCHSEGVAHNTASNFFRLANNAVANATGEDKNGTCMVCHQTGSSGYDPGSGNINATRKINANHYGLDHSAAADGGYFCWDCHDPHGEYNYTTTAPIAFMVQREPVEDHSGSAGTGIPTETAAEVDFHNNRDGSAGFGWGDYVSPTFEGVCQVCHDATVRYRKDTLYDTGHYAGQRCTNESCHKHDQAPSDAFKPAGGGDCLGCHETNTQGTADKRRAVGPDFEDGTYNAGAPETDDFRSHHVGSGATNSLQGTLTAHDCVVCHAEGEVVAGEVSTVGVLHGGDGGDVRINLRDADDLGASFAYDKDAIIAGAGNYDNWNSGNTTWSTQMENAMDPFCLSCHDADGASATFQNGEVGATALNPFNDNLITNNYDQVVRVPGVATPPWASAPGGETGRVIDIASKVSTDWPPGPGGIDPADRDQSGEARYDEAPAGADGIDDPPDGVYSRHAIRGQSLSVYTTEHVDWQNGADGNTYWNRAKFGWNDTSVMACADCHTNDGANRPGFYGLAAGQPIGNAHGADSEYLLKDRYGGAKQGTKADQDFVCLQCHDQSWYTGGTDHTANSQDYQSYPYELGVDRIPGGTTGGSIFGSDCLNCHGGYEFGSIHGSTQTFGVGDDGGAGTREAYRFTNGSSLRFYDPNGWTGTQSTCYTLGGQDQPWGGCTKHGGKTGSGSRTKTVVRDLKY